MSRTRRVILLPLVAAAVGILVGAVIMAVVLALVDQVPRDRDTFADLGLIVVGVFLAVIVGIGVWVAGLARAATALFDRGRRLGVLMASVLVVFALAVGIGAVAGWTEDAADLPRWAALTLSGASVAILVAVPSVVFRWWDRRLTSRAGADGDDGHAAGGDGPFGRAEA